MEEYYKNRNAKKIAMILNLSSKQISFEIDGVNKGVAFKDIKYGDDIYYRLAVSLEKEEDIVQLIDYQESLK